MLFQGQQNFLIQAHIRQNRNLYTKNMRLIH